MDDNKNQNTNHIYQDIIDKYYLNAKTAISQQGVLHSYKSPIHGARHIASTHVIANDIWKLYEKYKNNMPYEASIDKWNSKKSRELISIAMAFHDSGRVTEGVDHDEFSSAVLLLSYLIKNNTCDPLTAIHLAFCLAYKDKSKENFENLETFLNDTGFEYNKYINTKNGKIQKLKQLVDQDAINVAREVFKKDKPTQNTIKNSIARIVIHEADCIDIARVHEFDNSYMEYNQIFQDNKTIISKFNKFTKLYSTVSDANGTKDLTSMEEKYNDFLWNKTCYENYIKINKYAIKIAKLSPVYIININNTQFTCDTSAGLCVNVLKHKNFAKYKNKDPYTDSLMCLEILKNKFQELKQSSDYNIEKDETSGIYNKTTVYKYNKNEISAIRIDKKNKLNSERLIVKQIAKNITTAIQKTKEKLEHTCKTYDKTLLNNCQFLKLVIEFAITHDGMSRATQDMWENFIKYHESNNKNIKSDAFKNNLLLAKTISAMYQKVSLKKGFFTGRTKQLRTDKKIGSRLKRIPERSVLTILRHVDNLQI